MLGALGDLGGFVALDTGAVAVLEDSTSSPTRGCAVEPAIVGLTSSNWCLQLYISTYKHEINMLKQLTRLHKLQLASFLESVQKSNCFGWGESELRAFLLFNWWGGHRQAEREDLIAVFQPQLEKKFLKNEKYLCIFSVISGEINLFSIWAGLKICPYSLPSPLFGSNQRVNSGNFWFSKWWFFCLKSWMRWPLFWQADQRWQAPFPCR